MILVALLAFASAALAQSPQANRVVHAPEILSRAQPDFPLEASRARLRGPVVVKCLVAVNGAPENCAVESSLGMGLDEAALAAVADWRWSPARRADGSPALAYMTVAVNFGTPAANVWHMTRAGYDLPPGARRPHLNHAEFPRAKPSAEQDIELTFTIDEHGRPGDFNADKMDSKFVKEIVDSVRKWRFDPAVKDSVAVAVRAIFHFNVSIF